jgi:hypothetical protein
MVMLASVDDLATATGRAATDPVLLLQLRRASARFVGAVGRPIVQASDSWTLDGDGSDTLLLPDWPVSDVTVTVDGVEVDDFEISASTGVLRRSSLWPDRLGAITVSCTHGFDQIPDDIADAVLEQAEIALNTVAGLQQTSQGARSATFGTAATTGVTQKWSDAVAHHSARGDEC